MLKEDMVTRSYYVAAITQNTSEVFASIIDMPEDYDWKEDSRSRYKSFAKLREKVCEAQQHSPFNSTARLWREPNNVVILNCMPL